MIRPILDIKSNYVQIYYNKIKKISKHINIKDFSDIESYKVPTKYGYGDWTFKVIKSPSFGVCLNKFSNHDFKELVFDSNVLLISINTFGPGSVIKEHKDPAYFGKNTFRIFVPLRSKESYITANFGTIKCKEKKPYILDFIYEPHSGINKSQDEEFVIVAFDILYENNQNYEGEYLYTGSKTNDLLFNKVVNVNMEAYQKV